MWAFPMRWSRRFPLRRRWGVDSGISSADEGSGRIGCRNKNPIGEGGVWVMSDWEDRRLGDCVQMLSGGTPSKANHDYWNGDIPWVSAKDLKKFFLHDAQDHITQEAAQNETKIAPKNSTLILVRGMTLHNDLPIGCLTRDMAFNQDVKAIIADENLIESKYLAYWLLANKHQLMGLVESASHGTGRISTDDLKSVIITFPDLEEQKQISNLLGNFDRNTNLM